ncbi:MAG: hypothetical protein ACE37H_15135 [Phycisphaeraceae bacterium]
MFIIRKIGKTLRGQAKPYQIVAAALLGALIGFAPTFTGAPLYLIAAVCLLAVLNANFFIATFTAGVCKLLALALMPISFELGLLIVDGPLQPLFRTLINTPVTALMGFDYYVTTGGTVLALVVGTALGLCYLSLIKSFRKKMAKVEAESERYADYVSKRGVRILMWVLFGGKAKLSYAELMEQKKIGNPIRPLGVVFAALVLVLLVVVQQFASGPLITTLLRGELEQFHGATVDVRGVDFDLATGQLSVTQLAMADPDNLDYDLIRANELTAKVSTADLLRKRITIDRVLVDEARQGVKRDKPGVLVGKRPEPSPPSEEGKSIEEWFEQAKVWKQRLETYYDWYKKLKGPPEDEQAKEETAKDRLRRWAERYGHADVRAAHLVEGSPTVLVKEVIINKLRATWPKDETLNIRATNLSTHPALVEEPPRITVKSSKDSFDLNLAIAPAALVNKQSELKLTLQNQSIDETLADLDLGSQSTVKGGTWLATIDGAWSDAVGLNLPMTLSLQNTTLTLPGIEPTPIERMPVEFGVIGAIDAPRLDVDYEQLMQSIMNNAGQAVLNQYVGKASDQLKSKLNDALGEDTGGKINDLVGNLLGGGNKDEEDKEDGDEGDLEDKVREGIGNFGDLLNRNRNGE